MSLKAARVMSAMRMLICVAPGGRGEVSGLINLHYGQMQADSGVFLRRRDSSNT